ncbi:AAA+ superfamily ATPase [Corynebacterium renale]|uniref:ATP-binding protein n=1 Tax=Corynebacterium renale TaxID=1724 RepID=UPI000DA33C94|nr:ATP-binding protein [Corynebacterium renale]SQG63800.1 AAA+ superfamily ATPase [Corynebacterium renale]STD02231.1 AAA+ superfamily ATPase [Corynebacterium renale]
MDRFIQRTAADSAAKLAQWFPVVSVTGPRQSGKSTLVRHVFDGYRYVNLEDVSLRELAQDDPMGFVKSLGSSAIIDEAQRVPDVFSAVQVYSDESGKTGQYILSGSQNFLLQREVTQSLAGRVGRLELLPLTFGELSSSRNDISVRDFLVQGGYPRIYDSGIPVDIYCANYLRTYLQRDVGEYVNPQNVVTFEKFIRLCAEQAGNLVNYSSLARELGVDARTIKSWLSILESSYIVFMLAPFHSHTRKRVTKTPKLYFYDTGLLAYLLGVNSENYAFSQHKGALIENMVIAETRKKYLNNVEEPRLYFYRDDSKVEVDLLDLTKEPRLIEIKSSATYRSKFGKHLAEVAEKIGLPDIRTMVVYAGEGDYDLAGHTIQSLRTYLMD